MSIYFSRLHHSLAQHMPLLPLRARGIGLIARPVPFHPPTTSPQAERVRALINWRFARSSSIPVRPSRRPHDPLPMYAIPACRRTQSDLLTRTIFKTHSERDFFKDRFENPPKESYKVENCSSSLFIAGAIVAILGYVGLVVRGESRQDIKNPRNETESDDFKTLKEFVLKFNQCKSDEEKKQLYNQALAYIDQFRHLGNLSPRVMLNPDIRQAYVGLLLLTGCENNNIRHEAFKNLKLLLAVAHPEEPIATLTTLEETLAKQLLASNEINHSVPFLQDQIHCYRLVVEKLLIFCSGSGSKLSLERKEEIAARIHAIGKKLDGNPNFQYEAAFTKIVASYLPTPNQTVTVIVESVLGLLKMNLPEKIKSVISNILTIKTFSLESINKIEKLLKETVPDLIQEALVHINRLKSLLPTEKDSKHALLFLTLEWRVHDVNREWFQTFQSTFDDVMQGEDDPDKWVYLVRSVDFLSQVVNSSTKLKWKEMALSYIVDLIDEETPWQVRYKVYTVLKQLEHELLFDEVVKAGISRFQKLGQESDLRNAIGWYDVVFGASLEREKRLEDARSLTLPAMHEGLNLFNLVAQRKLRSEHQEPLIPRNGVLVRIAEEFQSRTEQHLTVRLLCGSPGIGKRHLALNYALKHIRDYSQVLWIDAAMFESDTITIADSFGAEKMPTVKEKQSYLRKFLLDNPGWLLIVANMTGNECGLLQAIIPPRGEGHVLITTSHPGSVEKHFPVKRIPVGRLSSSEAVYYLTEKLFSTANERDLARQIVVELGYHPQYLKMARGRIIKSNQSLATFQASYRKHNLEALKDNPEGVPAEQTIDTFWRMNLETIKANSVSFELLNVAAHLHHGSIPRFVLENWGELEAKANSEQINSAIMELSECCLIEGLSRRDLFSIPPVLQQVLRRRQGGSQPQYYNQALEALYNAVEKRIPKLAIIDAQSRQLAMQVEQVLSDEKLLKGVTNQDHVSSLYGFLSCHYGARLEKDKFLATQTRFLESLKTSSGPNQAAANLIQLSIDVMKGEDVAADEIPKEAIGPFMELFFMQILGLKNLFKWQREKNPADLVKARQFFEQVLKATKEDKDPKNAGLILAPCKALLGLVAIEENKLEDAKKLLNEAITDMKGMRNDSMKFLVIGPLLGLGLAHLKEGTKQEAKKTFQQALDILKEGRCDEKHPNVIFLRKILAKLDRPNPQPPEK